MNKYTVRGSAELDARIDVDMQRIAEVAAPHSLAGVLLGGYGRGEGTPFINPDGSQSPFNDYDLIVVVDRLDCKKFQSLEKQLTRELGLPVDLYPVLKRALSSCEFSMLNYEMKYGHKVVWGNENILEAMPDYPHDALPRSEGARLLLNRGKLLLDIKQRLENPEPLTAEERLRFIKFMYKVYLAFGDCALLAEGLYDLSYAVKKERIPNIGKIPDRDVVVDGYLKAIALKEWGDFQSLENLDIPAEFKAIRALFLRFLPWYWAQYIHRSYSIPSWMREWLCKALVGLLQDRAVLPAQLFYKLQRRFS